MLLEAVQLLCTAFELPTHVFDLRLTPWAALSPAERIAINVLPYARTKSQYNNPTARWVRASHGNFDAAISLAQALAAEFCYRFDKPHAALDWVVRHRAEAQVSDGPLQPYALAMPEKYSAAVLVGRDAYRAYYRNEKRGHTRNGAWVPAKWTRRQPPGWF